MDDTAQSEKSLHGCCILETPNVLILVYGAVPGQDVGFCICPYILCMALGSTLKYFCAFFVVVVFL